MYYWYGENKEFTTLGSNVWTWGIRAYRSRDFYNWDDLGLIIPPDTLNATSPLHFSQTLDRPHILYNKVTRKWVCWIKSMDTDGYFVIMQADRWLPQLAGTPCLSPLIRTAVPPSSGATSGDWRTTSKGWWCDVSCSFVRFSMYLHDVTSSVLLYIITFALRKSNQSFN